ncbi:tetratricopeptide repeat protein [Candidatus Poribacteria bacterium]|nr:tetratricopeptide repeat protein [Candidatus Poribacteria bacterium]
MKKITFTIITLLNLFFLNNLFAQEFFDVNKYFADGNSFYQKGQYDKAILEYEKIVNSGIKNITVYYNLGNAYYKSGKIGKSILSYERARLLIPRDADINFNLKFVKQAIRDKASDSGEIFLNIFTINELTYTSTIIYFILLIIIGLPIILKQNFHFKNSLLIIFFSAIFILSISSLIYKINGIEYTKRGVVISKELEVRSGPGPDNTLIFTIHEGSKVEIIKQEPEYYEVILPNGEKGWVDGKNVEII